MALSAEAIQESLIMYLGRRVMIPPVRRIVRLMIDGTMDAFLNIRTIPRAADLRSSYAFKQGHPGITGVGPVNYLNL